MGIRTATSGGLVLHYHGMIGGNGEICLGLVKLCGQGELNGIDLEISGIGHLLEFPQISKGTEHQGYRFHTHGIR